MTVYQYFFQYDDFQSIYNCSSHKYAYATAIPNIPLGIVYIIAGTIYELLYFPCLFVMIFSSDLRNMTCYRIMIYLGIVDILVVPLNATLSGIFSIMGTNYCTAPVVNFFAGAAATALWAGACNLCILLAFNRCLDAWKPQWQQMLFEGRRVFFWLTITSCYIFYIFTFTTPHVYNAQMGAWFFDPFVNHIEPPISSFINRSHFVNNISVISLLSVLYILICASFYYNKRLYGVSTKMNKVQRLIFLQAAWISVLNFSAAAIYVSMQWIDVSFTVIVIGQMTWQAGHGGAAIIYLIWNRTIHSRVVALLKCQWKQAVGRASIVGSVNKTTPVSQITQSQNFI
ncbi:hypothetical protein QR680_006207 [Steinernema hermaphroditum]|uniref:Uncharacterized protein n=1 Tax=Steinernema hermaphroditum TaxID=289476 RepID=A0AA39HUS5_9BILA|nr:hypothetical protein QR680_006207 [Steinernema hermaphroditum]